jgi:putative nucleotidyltransferase with HDIG domain
MNYVSIRVSTLRGDQKISFNVYFKLGEKMILYLREGDSFEGVRLNRLKDKKLKKLYILDEDESKYRDYLQRNIESAYDNNSKKDMEIRASIVQASQQANAEEVMENPANVESYNIAKEASSQYVQFIMTNDSAFKALMAIENLDQDVAHHGVTVATLSVALAHKLGMNDSKQNQLLTLGALLHDLGHQGSSVPPPCHLPSLSPEELVIYKKHPEVGMLKVQQQKHFDPVVVNIIMKHEECIDGSGYPSGLEQNAQDDLIQIVSTCNALDRLMTFENIPKTELTKKMTLDRVGKHPLNYIQLLSEILKSSF